MKVGLHPLTWFLRRALLYFHQQGFDIVEGRDIEIEEYNFNALNVPADHPSRDIQDTFWLKNGKLLRTHTTASDIRIVKERHLSPPFRLIIPGRCYRNEATDPNHEHTFYQMDGIAVEKNLTMGHLIGLLNNFIKFGNKAKTRIRPHYYPFVEPGLDMDLWTGKRWEEMLGAGMAHPVVLKNLGITPEEAEKNQWQGIMFGLGIDRYMMRYFGIDDIRLSYSGDLRFLKQF